MRFIFIFISLLFLLSCSKEYISPQVVPYYQFTNVSKEWFTDLKQYDTLKFISNLGRTRTYTVFDIALTKEKYATYDWTLGTESLYFYFDQRTISFHRTDSFSKVTTIRIYAFAPDSNDLKNPVSSDKGIVKAFFQFDDYIGKPPGAFANLLTDFIVPINFITYTIGSRTINDVIEFSCNCTTSFYDTVWNRWDTISKIRYSKTKGFINFEMTTGEIWNRQF